MNNYPLVDKAFVINLKSEAQRLEHCYKEFKDADYDFESNSCSKHLI